MVKMIELQAVYSTEEAEDDEVIGDAVKYSCEDGRVVGAYPTKEVEDDDDDDDVGVAGVYSS